MALNAGQKAPDFSLPDETGKIHTLADYLGKTIVLYFYPKDNTPGCTIEACRFRDDYSDYHKADVVILGVSPDNSTSHAKFKNKFNLPFTLLADSDKATCKDYGVWVLKKMMGQQYHGVLRTTFLINKDGIILKVYENVSPATHSAEILQFLTSLEK